jgi:hypothetical protein
MLKLLLFVAVDIIAFYYIWKLIEKELKINNDERF